MSVLLPKRDICIPVIQKRNAVVTFNFFISFICTHGLCRYNDLLWEPGLWTVYTKIHSIREVFWSFNKKATREALLKSKTSLGLKNVISSLGFSNADNDLYDSIMFLRKKIVAHQDSAYEKYSGKKVQDMDDCVI